LPGHAIHSAIGYNQVCDVISASRG
jgi:hypothetical protein